MIVNGNSKDFPSDITIDELIETMGFPKNIVIVKVNGKRIPKENYNEKLDKDSNIEIYSFIGGG
ncbi:ThiS family protein [Maledivibacter halophilus]|uniref:ThiS family protein n=2 Tax=Maledivibacter halophilus TaxID=36842 RepID=A0A1T5L0A4_9FIRM|nr:ThiS family protein [Maledivibacter halophilus]